MVLSDFYTPIADYDTLQKVILILSFLGKNIDYLTEKKNIKFPIVLYCIGLDILDYLSHIQSIDPNHEDYDIFRTHNLQLITFEQISKM